MSSSYHLKAIVMKRFFWVLTCSVLMTLGFGTSIQAADPIFGPAVGISISPKVVSLTADETQAFTVTATDANQKTWDATSQTDFFVDRFAGVMGQKGLFDPQKVGESYTIRAVAYGYADDASVTIREGKRATLEISPALASLKAGTTFDFDLISRDADGNVLSGNGVVWSSDLTNVGTVDASGVFTAKALGNTYVRAQADGLSASALAMVSTPTFAKQLVMTPEKITTPADETITLKASYVDEFGNTTDVTAQTKWKVTDPSGRIEGNTYFPGSVGDWQLTATANGLSDTATVTVTHGSAVTLVMSPTTMEISSDQKQGFLLEATDRDGNTWDAESDVILSTTDPLGAFSGNVYHPGSVGVWDITATVDEAVASATVTVVSGGAKQLQIQPQPLKVNIGETLTILVKGFDQDRNMVDVTDRSELTVSGGGTLSGNEFTASKSGAFTLTATYDGLSESSSLVVEDSGNLGVPPALATNEDIAFEPSESEDQSQEDTPLQNANDQTPLSSEPGQVLPPEGTVRGEEAEPEVFRSEPQPVEPIVEIIPESQGAVKGAQTLSPWWYGVLASLLVLLGFVGWKLVQKTNNSNR